LEWAEPIAYGPLELQPHEFEKLQPHEFIAMWDGYQWRQEREEDKLAYFTACQMSVHTKRPIHPKDLLKNLRKKTKRQPVTDDE
jgi:hypothetical protein